MIALVRAQEQAEELPHAALITGRLDISNNGHKTIIDASGGSSVSGLVAVRCTPQLLELKACLGHKLVGGLLSSALASLNALLQFQINPNVTVTGYAAAPAMKAEAIARLRLRAQADGTYYATCPAERAAGRLRDLHRVGQLPLPEQHRRQLALEPRDSCCWPTGRCASTGTQKYYGIIYSANLLGLATAMVDVGGNVQVHGGVLIDGADAQMIAGSSKVNIQLDINAFNAVKSYGAAGIIQNTFREIKGA